MLCVTLWTCTRRFPKYTLNCAIAGPYSISLNAAKLFFKITAPCYLLQKRMKVPISLHPPYPLVSLSCHSLFPTGHMWVIEDILIIWVLFSNLLVMTLIPFCPLRKWLSPASPRSRLTACIISYLIPLEIHHYLFKEREEQLYEWCHFRDSIS